MADFYTGFKQREGAIRGIISDIECGRVAEPNRWAAIETGLTSISLLSDYVRDAAGSLPSYDLRNYSKAIDSLRKSLQETETTLAPKRKFAFKKLERSGRVALPGTAESSTAVGQQLRQDEHTSESDARPSKFAPERPASPTSNAHTGFRLSKLKDKQFMLTPLEKNGASAASLEDIAKSSVDISIQGSQEAPFAALMVQDVEKSLLVLGNIAGSAHMTDIANSTIFVTAQQIRLHNCHEVVLYVRCSSRPIIEGCTGIRFAPLNYLFGTEDVRSNLSKSNFWDQVDDFKWLKAEPSPNWSVLKADDDRAISDERCYDILTQSKSNLDLKASLASAMIPL